MTLVRLPLVFFQDHMWRALDTPESVKENARHVWAALDDPALFELYSDAEYYAHPYGPDAEGLGGLKASARATMKAIDKALTAAGREPFSKRFKGLK